MEHPPFFNKLNDCSIYRFEILLLLTKTMNGDFDDRWSSLPAELLQQISDTFDSPLDVLRARSVCSVWRSHIPPPSFEVHACLPHLKLPLPLPSDIVLVHSTVCRLNLLHPRRLSKSKGWLTKVNSSTTGRLRLLQPISNNQVRYSIFKLSLEDVRFVDIAKASLLVQTSNRSPVVGINKVVCFNGNSDDKDDDFSILAIIHEGKLCYWKNGDEKWTVLDDKNLEYDDIINYKGNFYVVDRCGTVSWIDSSLNVIQYSPPLYGCGTQKNLVESCGDLYVVDTYLDSKRRKWPEDDYFMMHHTNAGNLHEVWKHQIRRYMRSSNPKAVDFRVYRLDEEWGKWVDVKSLGDRAFVLDTDCCFSVSAKDFVGGQGNCIYFSDDRKDGQRGFNGNSINVYQLASCCIEKLELVPQYSKIFWPPATPGCSNVPA